MCSALVSERLKELLQDLRRGAYYTTARAPEQLTRLLNQLVRRSELPQAQGWVQIQVCGRVDTEPLRRKFAPRAIAAIHLCTETVGFKGLVN